MLQILSSLLIVTPIVMNFVPESPRWLLATNEKSKMDEARDILKQAAIVNGTLDENTEDKLSALVKPKSAEEQAIDAKNQLGFLHLFRAKVLRKRALVMYFNWFANSFILYGLSLNWQSLTGSLFTNFCIGA
jgi:OCT family organic cation transporter-like MFS transporter 4/5